MVNLSKLDNNTQGEMVKRSIVNLDKSLKKLNLEKVIAAVGVCLDYSGSMRWAYQDTISIAPSNTQSAPEQKKGLFGKLKQAFTSIDEDSNKISPMQKLLLRLMPLALRFDDDGNTDVWSFWDNYKSLEPLTLNNYTTYVVDEIRPNSHFGGTKYLPVLEDVVNFYSNSKYPAYVLYITDGASQDRKTQIDKFIREMADKNIFVMFVGMGDDDFEYLSHLDDLDGRVKDNTGFVKVKDFDKLSDNELYELLLKEFKQWLGR